MINQEAEASLARSIKNKTAITIKPEILTGLRQIVDVIDQGNVVDKK